MSGMRQNLKDELMPPASEEYTSPKKRGRHGPQHGHQNVLEDAVRNRSPTDGCSRRCAGNVVAVDSVPKDQITTRGPD